MGEPYSLASECQCPSQLGLTELWLEKQNNNNKGLWDWKVPVSQRMGCPQSPAPGQFKTLGALSHLQASSSHTLGIIGLADETNTEEQGRQGEEDSEALLGKRAFPLPVELTAPLHAGPLSGPGVAWWAEKQGLDGLSAVPNTCTRGAGGV